MLGSAPPGLDGVLPGALLRRRTPTAPAFCALTDLAVKLHPPRSATTILPETAAGNAWQASVTVPTPVVPVITAVLPSSASMSELVTSNVCGP